VEKGGLEGGKLQEGGEIWRPSMQGWDNTHHTVLREGEGGGGCTKSNLGQSHERRRLPLLRNKLNRKEGGVLRRAKRAKETEIDSPKSRSSEKVVNSQGGEWRGELNNAT